ncbi:hypothetical protein CYLTODRAFT_487537 [Cylindrobasidium torrendii FP15055 ss-10]|uniref:Inositol-pentakisphosphate 2-kinase n=1 Tax=Cylindrobasidium torrendii FP15055 ss-10 TaxID=1314674 RepID=A0A0D7BKM9_9AGAR|nr:hypothetical protein CYLTODRAFT_487537 [Cylindrobasidium torrendii FP15055 ss-10]
MSNSPVEISVLSTRPADWRYVSEGGATAVFSYVGPANASFDGMVLRLRKAGVSTPVLEKVLSQEFEFGSAAQGAERVDEPDDASIVFQEQCMEKLIPPVHLPRLSSVRVDQTWLEEFARFHNASRPLVRSVAGGIDPARTKAVLANDLVGGSGLAVEIKPKWSFLPNLKYLSDSTLPVKSRTCRFCMHSHIRDSNGEAVSIGYCPLDLFSNDPARMKKAVHSLYDNWVKSEGQVNNLKVFVKGKKISFKERFSMLQAGEESDEELRETFSDAIMRLLVGTPVLQLLNRIQRTLDPLDIEGVWHLWRQAHPTSAHLAQNEANPTLADWTAFIDSYHSRVHFTSEEPKVEDLRYHLIAYLLSATFKDCSIIVRMPLLDPARTLETVNQENVTIIDLDPKNMDRLKKWHDLDTIIAWEYSTIPEAERKTCSDGWDLKAASTS